MQPKSVTADRSPVGRQFVGLPIACEFTRLQLAYESTGGMARTDALAGWLENLQPGTVADLAGQISSREIFGFHWRGEHWIPLFQIDPADMSVNPASRRVVAEFGGAHDGWTLATWFAEPNRLLDGRRPVEVLGSDLPDVVDAAKAGPFPST